MRPDDEKKTGGESSSIDNGDQLPPKEPELVDGGYGVSGTQPCSITSHIEDCSVLSYKCGILLERS